jgi:hypothetical protein
MRRIQKCRTLKFATVRPYDLAQDLRFIGVIWSLWIRMGHFATVSPEPSHVDKV